MQLNEWLKSSAQRLEAAHVETARLDCLVLLEDVIGHDRAWLLANPESEIDSVDLVKLGEMLIRRSSHEPLAYIRNKTEFYGRSFVITHNVLEPRPESETMIESLKELPIDLSIAYIADVGTGSGALGITAALELQNSHIELLDIDDEALNVAKMNVDKYTIPLTVASSNLLTGASQENDVLLCNLPYVPDDFEINLAAQYEPKLAIFGGRDGLDLYRSLFDQIDELTKKPLYILSESLPSQHQELEGLALKHGYKLAKTSDFIQVFKS